MAIPLSFDSQDGTLDAVIASGRLGLIADRHLRELLAGWKSMVEDADEEVAVIRERGNRIQDLEAQLGGPWRGAVPSVPGGGSVSRQTRRYPEADLNLIANDSRRMALARTKVFSAGRYLDELTDLLGHAEAVLELVKANRQ